MYKHILTSCEALKRNFDIGIHIPIMFSSRYRINWFWRDDTTYRSFDKFVLSLRSCSYILFPIIVHSKQKRNFTEPLKKVQQIRKSLQMCSKFQKKNKKIYRTFKGSSPGYTGRSFFLRNLFKFRRAKNRFCRKRRNLQSFALKIMVLYETQCQNLDF